MILTIQEAGFEAQRGRMQAATVRRIGAAWRSARLRVAAALRAAAARSIADLSKHFVYALYYH